MWASQVALVLKNQFANARYKREKGFDSRVRKVPWWRAQQPTPIFVWRILWTEGWSIGSQESDMPEAI